MNKETKNILATLEILLESCRCIHFGGHEDGGYIYPFVWEKSKQGEFNPFDLGISKGWLMLIDNDAIETSMQAIEYCKSFNSFSLKEDEEEQRIEKTIALLRLLENNLQELETFETQTFYYAEGSINLIIGRTIDGDWISVCPTAYIETSIPQQQISRTIQEQEFNFDGIGENTKSLILEMEAIISELGTINISGDFGKGYTYDYPHSVVYAASKTKESVVEKVLQSTGILELSQFQSFYSQMDFFDKYEHFYKSEESDLIYEKYNQINEFLNQTFSKVMMYRFSFWDLENIYIIGETQSCDWVGIHIRSNFIYNP